MKKVTYLYLVYLFLPIILLFMGSFGESWVNTMFPTGFTFAWYQEIWQTVAYRNAFFMSIKVCLSVCLLNFIIITPIVYLLQINNSNLSKKLTRLSALLPIAMPELVIGFGFILAFTKEATPWLGSTWLLILGHFILTFPYFFFTAITTMERSPFRSLDLMAQSFGAGVIKRFFSVFMPLVSKSLMSGIITVAAISLGEFQLSNLISGFMNRTYPTLLLQAFYGATGLACAATVILLLLAISTSLLSNHQYIKNKKGI